MEAQAGNSSETTHFNPSAFKLRSRATLEELAKAFAEAEGGEAIAVLDYGCGNGMMSELLEKAGYRVTATDIGAQQLERAKARLASARIVQGHVNEVEFEPSSFDAIVSLEVIEHLYDPAFYLRRAWDFLKPDGLFVMSTPYYGYLKNLAIAIKGDWDKHFMVDELHGHIKLFSREKLVTMVEQSGFRIENWQRLGRIGPMAMMQMVTVRKNHSL